MDTIAPLANASNTLDTFAKYVRVMEKAGVNFDQFTLPINNRAARRNLADFLKAGCPKLTIKADGTAPSADMTCYKLASAVLGEDFISPEEVAKSRGGVVYTDDQLAQFGDTVPSQEVLEWCRDNGYMVVAGPNRPMSMLEIRDLRSDYFYSKKGGWYAEQAFARNDKADTRWIMLRKETVPESTSKNWTEQQALLSDNEITPNAAELVWCVTTYKAIRNVCLLPSIYVHTSSLDSGGIRIVVGCFLDRGLDVSHWNDDDHDGRIGLSAARKQ